MRDKLCLIYNYAQHYRLGIFKLMDEQMNVDFYFGDKMADIKKLDYTELSGFKKELKNIRLFSNFYWQKGAVALFNKKYKKYLLLGEYYCLSTWVILLLSKFSSKKVYLWSHGWYGKENEIIAFIKKVFFGMADGTFLYGDYAKELMIREGVNSHKLHVIYNSLNYAEQLEIRRNLKKSEIYENHFGNNNPVLIFIGRLTKVKKLNYIIDVQKQLYQDEFPVNLVIIGDGEERDTLRSLVADYKLDSTVWFVGKLYDESLIAQYIYNADLCISPGNVGLTAMHALVYGTPVITNNNFSLQMPEFEAIKEGSTGTFFQEDNLQDLGLKIKVWLKNEGKEREAVRENCYSVIDNFYNPRYQHRIISSVIEQ